MDPEECSPEEHAWLGSGQSRWDSYRGRVWQHETESEASTEPLPPVAVEDAEKEKPG